MRKKQDDWDRRLEAKLRANGRGINRATAGPVQWVDSNYGDYSTHVDESHHWAWVRQDDRVYRLAFGLVPAIEALDRDEEVVPSEVLSATVASDEDADKLVQDLEALHVLSTRLPELDRLPCSRSEYERLQAQQSRLGREIEYLPRGDSDGE